jgi:hypothetical protein
VNIRCFVCILLFNVVFVSFVVAFSPGDEVILSFPQMRLAKSERIVGFEINATTGHIIAVDRIPQGWSVSVQAEVSSKSAISGAPGHGAGALFRAAELPEVTIRVGKLSIERSPNFSVEAAFHVTADFEKTRTIRLRQSDLVLKKKGI